MGRLSDCLAAFAASRWVESQLFGVRSTDPLTFAAVCLLLLASAVIACVIPAWRAMRVDPAVALRNTLDASYIPFALDGGTIPFSRM